MKVRSMRGQRWAVVVMLSTGASLGCQQSPPPDPAEAEIESAESVFQPPPDGRLTEDQVRMYVTATRDASPAPRELPSVVDREELLAAVERQSRGDAAAVDLPGSVDHELPWVQARVMEAQLPDDARLGDLGARVNAASLEAVERQREETSDPEEKARLAAQVAALEARRRADEVRSAEGPDPSAREHNRELLKRDLGDDDPPRPGQ